MSDSHQHRVSVIDHLRITVCTCGLQVFTTPGTSALFEAFYREHAEIVGAA